MIGEIWFTYSDVINIVLFLSTVLGFYYKIRIGMKELDVKIAAIQADRKERWDAYEKKQYKQDECLENIMQGINLVSGDVKAIKTDIDWLKLK